MRTSAPPLLPIFRSDVQGRLLALIFARPAEEQTVSDLARRLDAHVSTVHREVDRLSQAGILQTRLLGRTRLVRAGSDSPYVPELAALVLKAFGPVPLLRQLVARIGGVDEAYVFGSWAERYHGVTGPVPGDIDVLLVGRPDREVVHATAAEAGRIAGIAVDIVIRSPETWNAGEEGLIRSIRAGHLVPLHGESP